jgi:hypothetical protein
VRYKYPRSSVDTAWIAVIGTLAGVGITVLGGISTALIASKNQRLTAEQQNKYQVSDKLRKERRDVFVEYLTSYQKMYGEARIIADRRFRGGESSAIPDGQFEAGRIFERHAPQQAIELGRAYYTLVITSGPGVRFAADACTSTLWAVARASVAGDSATYDTALNDASRARKVLRDKMREELEII